LVWNFLIIIMYALVTTIYSLISHILHICITTKWTESIGITSLGLLILLNEMGQNHGNTFSDSLRTVPSSMPTSYFLYLFGVSIRKRFTHLDFKCELTHQLITGFSCRKRNATEMDNVENVVFTWTGKK
jgi:hypothetical protein